MRERGQLEAEIIHLLQRNAGTLSARQLQDMFSEPVPAYSTLMTALTRLVAKGRVDRSGASPRKLRFGAVRTDELSASGSMVSALNEARDRRATLSAFARRLSSDDLAALSCPLTALGPAMGVSIGTVASYPPTEVASAQWRQALPPQRRGRQRRAEILRAATELIDAEGPNGPGISIRGITDRAGTSPATVYHYFDDIDAVVGAVAAEYMDGLVAAVAPAFGTHAGAREFLDAVVGGYRSYFAARPGLRELWFDRRANPIVIQIHAHYRADLTGKLLEEMARHSSTPGTLDDHAITVALVGSLWELAFARDPRGDPAVVQQIIELCCDYWQRRFDVPMRR